MNWTRYGLIGLIAIGASAAFLGWSRKAETVDEHRRVRQLVLYYTLQRIDDPIIVLGDSIVEASTLPRSICGRSIVNAGLNGASTASDLGSWLSPTLDGRKAAAIVISLGTNDALVTDPQSKQKFADRYGALLAQLSTLTSRLVVVEVPPVEAAGRMTSALRDEVMGTINNFNSILPDLAKRGGATFVLLPAMPAPHTIDGVHLNAAGYLAWDKAVLQGAAMICPQN